MDELLDSLSLERVGHDRYRATNVQMGNPIVLGGQLLAQSIIAGVAGQEDKALKTLSTIFARGGAPETPVEITVDPMHSGRSLASSTVTISQGDRLSARSLVLLSADEPDVIRHADQPRSGTGPEDPSNKVRSSGPWELAVVGGVDVNDPDDVGPPELDVWVRFSEAPDDPAVNQALVAFITDGFLIGTAMRPHPGVGQAQAHQTLSTGVLSHTITFHEPCSAASWLLLSHRSPYAGRGRSYAAGNIFEADGRLVASFIQDGMIRARSGGPGAL